MAGNLQTLGVVDVPAKTAKLPAPTSALTPVEPSTNTTPTEPGAETPSEPSPIMVETIQIWPLKISH